MGNSNSNIPPIPAKEGTYKYEKGNIIYVPKGSDTEDGTVVAPYIPPKKDKKESDEEYNKRIKKDVNRVIDKIERNKDHVDAKARKHSIDSTYELGDTGLTFKSAFKSACQIFKGGKGEITKKI